MKYKISYTYMEKNQPVKNQPTKKTQLNQQELQKVKN